MFLPNADAGALGLILLAQFHGIAADVDQIRHEFAAARRANATTN